MSHQIDELPVAESPVDMAPEQPAQPLPGSLLRSAREARSLTVFEVAQSLKFSPRQIEALEADDYAALPPGTTFLRGFVRGYAKLLKLDPEPLLAMLDARAPAAPPDVRAPQNMGVAATPVAGGRRSSRPLLIGSAVLAALAAGLAIWQFAGQPEEQLAVAPAPAESTSADIAGVRPPEVRVEATPVPPAAEPAAGAPLPADQHQLVFSFQGKSWVEVKDASQRVVFSAENAPGTRQVVSGKPPFQVVVGNAAQVEVQYDDRQVDLKPHTRAEVARLTIE